MAYPFRLRLWQLQLMKPVQAAEKLGYPLSVKIHSADIQHKSDVGGVKLNIKHEAELRAAFETVMTNCRNNAPEAKLEGVLLKPMLKQVLR